MREKLLCFGNIGVVSAANEKNIGILSLDVFIQFICRNIETN